MQALADAGGMECERVGGLEQTARQFQDVVQGLAQRQGTGANGADIAPYPLVGKNVVPKGLTNTTSFKQWIRRYELLAGAKDERLKTLLEGSELRDAAEPTIAPVASGIPGAEKLT